VVISHHILDGKHQQYEEWLSEIAPICKSYPGHMDWQIIRPIPNLTFIYTVVIRFDNIKNLKNWMASQDRERLIEKAKPLFAKDDRYYINSGLDFLFLPLEEKTKIPTRWKQYLVTWSVIFPLVLGVPLVIIPLSRMLPIPQHPILDT